MSAGVRLSDGRVWTWEPGRDGAPGTAWSAEDAPADTPPPGPRWMTPDDFLRCGQYLLERHHEFARETAHYRLEELHRVRLLLEEFTRRIDAGQAPAGPALDALLAEGRAIVRRRGA